MARLSAKVFSPSNHEKYYYYTEGDPNNPWLVLLPGFSGIHTDFLEVAFHLRDTHFVVIPDLPGWGKSDTLPTAATIENYAAYIHELLEYLGGKTAGLLGHCSGNSILFSYIQSYPEKVYRAFLVSVPYQKGMLSDGFFVHLSDMSQKVPGPFKRIFFLWRARLFIIPYSFFSVKIKSLRKKIRFILHGIFSRGLQREQIVEENWNSFIHFDFSKIYTFEVPMHIIHGALDIVIPLKQIQKFHKLIPQATLDVIPAAGHLPPIETPGSLASLIKKYNLV